MNEELRIKITAQVAEAQKNLKEIQKQIGEVGNAGEKGAKKFGDAFKKMGEATGKALKAVATATGVAVAAAAAGVVALTKSAVESYAEYEQLVGGVDTLFKDSSQKLQQYAAEAYKTAGISANEYMKNVTSFSASLLQATAGDTSKAADIANMAMQDMADNANKMGTSMESIQNAYQGFAKQNYTMLDNLKLGYGGTKSEMERLLADAEKLSGVKYDISNLADVYNAIHVIQEKLDITGTTAKEAASTIQGSASMMKASWSNLITGMANENADFDTLLTQFIDSVGTFAENLIPRIEIALGGIVKLIGGLAPKIVEVLPQVVNTIIPSAIGAITEIVNAVVVALPSVLEGIVGAINTIFPQIVSALSELAPTLIKTVLGLIPQITGAILNALPLLLSTVVEVILAIAGEIGNVLPQLVDQIVTIVPQLISQLVAVLPTLIITLVDAILSNLPIILEGIITLVVEIVKQLPTIISVIVDMLPTLISMIIEAIFTLLPQIIGGVLEILWEIAKALPSILWDTIVVATINTLAGIWDGLSAVFGNLFDWFLETFEPIITWVDEKLVTPIKEFFTGLWNGIVEAYHTVIDPWIEIFKRLAAIVDEKIVTPIKEFFGEMWDSIKKKASDAWEGIKNVFSPVVNWFKDVFEKAWKKVKDVFSTGGKIFSGIKEGIESTFKLVVNKIIGGINTIIEKPFKAINSALSKISGIEILGVKPFTWIHTFDIPQIPLLAKGGVVDSATLAMIGERGKEAVVPLENNTEWMDMLASKLSARMGGNTPIVLQVDGQTFARTAIRTINANTAQTGRIGLNII